VAAGAPIQSPAAACVGTSTLRDGSVRLEQRLLVETLNQRESFLATKDTTLGKWAAFPCAHCSVLQDCKTEQYSCYYAT